MDWDDVKALPTFVINLDRSIERWNEVSVLIKQAGFTNIGRFAAIDASNPKELEEAWALHGNPPLNINEDREFGTYLGKQGCLLSHVGIWKMMIEKEIKMAVIFEDDVKFHPEFANLAPQYWQHTPRDFDVLYIGAQLDMYSSSHIARVPTFCTHAMIVTLEGAKKLYNFVIRNPYGVRTIDCMLKEEMEAMLRNPARKTFQWYAWNGTHFPTEEAKMDKGWTKRNMGLVFQDEKWGSLVREW